MAESDVVCETFRVRKQDDGWSPGSNVCRRRNLWGARWWWGEKPLQYFFLPKNTFYDFWVEEEQI